MAERPTPSFVFFDVGGTLLRADPSVGEIYSRTAESYGIERSPGELNAAFRAAWKASLARSAARGHECSDEILRREWREIVAETFGEGLEPDAFSALFEDLYSRFVSADAWTLSEGAREVLDSLREAGIRLGVLSNWDSRLPQTLAHMELDPYFEVQVASFEVGFEKPHPAMFRTALERCGVPAGEVMHVGDSLKADILPARELGIRTLWVTDPNSEEVAGAGERVGSLAEWPGLV